MQVLVADVPSSHVLKNNDCSPYDCKNHSAVQPSAITAYSGSKLTYKSVTKSTDDVLKLSTEVIFFICIK